MLFEWEKKTKNFFSFLNFCSSTSSFKSQKGGNFNIPYPIIHISARFLSDGGSTSVSILCCVACFRYLPTCLKLSIILGTIYTNFFLVDFSGRKRKLSQHHQKKVKIKRPRTSFNVDQLSILEGEFHQNPYLTESRRKTLAQNLQLDDSQIKARIIYNFPLIEKKKLLAFIYISFFLGGGGFSKFFPCC